MLFRPQALAHLDSPDELEGLMKVTDPRGWLALVALGLMVGALGVWAVIGTLTIQVSGRGILLGDQGVQEVYAPASGTLQPWAVRAGDRVTAGQAVTAVLPDPGPAREVVMPDTGEVLEIFLDAGAPVQAGQPLMLVAAEGQEADLHALLFVDSYAAGAIRPGMDVRIEPDTSGDEHYGLLMGVVQWVSPYPASARGMNRLLDNPELVRQLAVDGAPIAVRVALERDSSSPDGYAWTSRRPLGSVLRSGSLCTGRVILRTVHPIDMLLRGGAQGS